MSRAERTGMDAGYASRTGLVSFFDNSSIQQSHPVIQRLTKT